MIPSRTEMMAIVCRKLIRKKKKKKKKQQQQQQSSNDSSRKFLFSGSILECVKELT